MVRELLLHVIIMRPPCLHADREGEGATALVELSKRGPHVPSSTSADLVGGGVETMAAADMARARMSVDHALGPASSAAAGGATTDDSAIDTLMHDAGQQTGSLTGRPVAEGQTLEAATDAFYSRIAALAGSVASGERPCCGLTWYTSA